MRVGTLAVIVLLLAAFSLISRPESYSELYFVNRTGGNLTFALHNHLGYSHTYQGGTGEKAYTVRLADNEVVQLIEPDAGNITINADSLTIELKPK